MLIFHVLLEIFSVSGIDSVLEKKKKLYTTVTSKIFLQCHLKVHCLLNKSTVYCMTL